MGDVLAIAALFAGVIAFFVAVILGAMRVEAWRQRRAALALARGLEGGRLSGARGPGAWSLAGVEGQRAGVRVTLQPRALDRTIAMERPSGGPTRMRAMGVELVIGGTRQVGRGTLRAHRRELQVEGELAPLPAATRRALMACGAEIALDGREARAEFALPLSQRTVAEMLALIDALGPYLVGPPDALGPHLVAPPRDAAQALQTARAGLLRTLGSPPDALCRLLAKRGDALASAAARPPAFATRSSVQTMRKSPPSVSLTQRATALHRAVERQDVEEVEALLATGADPNALDARGRPPLAGALPWAVGFQLTAASERIIGALLAAGGDITRNDVGRKLVADADAMVCSAAEAGDVGRLETLLGLR